MIEPLQVFSLLLSPCIAYIAGALLFWWVESRNKFSESTYSGEQSI